MTAIKAAVDDASAGLPGSATPAEKKWVRPLKASGKAPNPTKDYRFYGISFDPKGILKLSDRPITL
ncbi:MAG TPA: hypothetical protein VMU33_08120 [Burkholderiaceae bacterium]|nr:hypothetical protein [Burkholderiaceae bacterium]